MLPVLFQAALLFALLYLAGLPFALLLPRLSAAERFAAGFGIVGILLFTIGFAAYSLDFSAAGYRFATAMIVLAAAMIGALQRRRVSRLLRVNTALILLALLGTLFYVCFQALLPFPALGDWYNDWWLNYQLALFYQEQLPATTRWMERYTAVARPPMYNLCCAYLMQLTGGEYADFQIISTVLSLGWTLPAFLLARMCLPRETGCTDRNVRATYLLARMRGPRRIALGAVCLLLFAVFIFKNTTYTWPKLFCAYYILLALYFYLKWLRGAQSAARNRCEPQLATAIVAFFAAYMIHQVALLYMAPIFLHFIYRLARDRKGDKPRPFPWCAVWISLPFAALLIVPYHVWAFKTFGWQGYFESNPAVFYAQDPQYSGWWNFVRIRASNVYSTLLPFAAYQNINTFGLSRPLAHFSRLLAVYYKTLPGNIGFTLGLGLFWFYCFRARRGGAFAAPRRCVFAWSCAIAGGALCFLILGHPFERDWGLASVGLAPAVMLLLMLLLPPMFSAPSNWPKLLILFGVQLEFGYFCWGQVAAFRGRLREIVANDANARFLFAEFNPTRALVTLEAQQREAFGGWLALAMVIHLILLALAANSFFNGSQPQRARDPRGGG